jgi:hypothetical protein
MKTPRVVLIALVSVAAAVPSSLLACGKERWLVKVGEDKDVARVNITVQKTNIAKLVQIGAPINPNIRKDTRYKPTEFQTLEINGQLTLIKKEADQDYHIVVKDNRGRTMIVESPDPGCAGKSRFLKEITEVRANINKFFGGPITGKQTPNSVYATVTGVAFFDKIHGQTGVAPNGIELHPILHIDLRNTP